MNKATDYTQASFTSSVVPTITAAMLGISARGWVAVIDNEEAENLARKHIAEQHFDVVPILRKEDEQLAGYFEASSTEQVLRKETDSAEKLYYLTEIRDLLRLMANRPGVAAGGRNFYFLTNFKDVVGLISEVNLHSRECNVYMHALFVQFELAFSQWLVGVANGQQALVKCADTLPSKRKSLAIKIALKNFKKDQEENNDSKFTEYLGLSDLFTLLEFSELSGTAEENVLKASLGAAKKLLIDLRNWVAHPVKRSPSGGNLAHDLHQGVEQIHQLMEQLARG